MASPNHWSQDAQDDGSQAANRMSGEVNDIKLFKISVQFQCIGAGHIIMAFKATFFSVNAMSKKYIAHSFH